MKKARKVSVALPLLLFMACTHTAKVAVKIPEDNVMDLSPAWPHGKIENVVDNVFFVTGTNIIVHDGMRLQDSRNMVIVREGHELTLINTVRLNDEGLKTLDSLGAVKNVIRIGAFHGRDDAFYQKRYGAKLWAFPSMHFMHGEHVDFDLTNKKLPIKNAELIPFTTTTFPEAVILLHQDGGILISCDSIKNWTKKDQFFDNETFLLMKKAGSIGEALIDDTWRKAMKPSIKEIENLLSLNFTTLISAHGPPLLNIAKEALTKSIQDLKARKDHSQ